MRTDVANMSGADFGFPFEPYDIQLEFMRAMYSTLAHGHVGIFESPTGTGKSLSILCAVLTWLRDHEADRRSALDQQLVDIDREADVLDADPNWVKAQSKRSVLTARKHGVRDERKLLDDFDAKIRALRNKTLNQELNLVTCKRKMPTEDECDDMHESTTDDDADLAPTSYDSDSDVPSASSSAHNDETVATAEDTQQLTAITQIFYCSRTHTQLAQFLRELQRCRTFVKETRVCTIGSRQTFCINDAVRTPTTSAALVNDRCMHLLQSTSSSSKAAKTTGDIEDVVTQRRTKAAACPYHKGDKETELGEQLLLRVRDTDSSVRLARQLSACPYYALRRVTLPFAQLVLCPYQILLHDEARRAWGLRLRGAVVVVDEAHNLFDSLAQMYTVDIKGGVLESARAQLAAYTARFASRLSAKNLMYVRQLTTFIERLQGAAATGAHSVQVMTINKFLMAHQLQDVNLFKLCAYIECSELCRKLFGYASRCAGRPPVAVDENTPQQKVMGIASLLSSAKTVPITNVSAPLERVPVNSAMYSVKSFLKALCSHDADGRIMIRRDDNGQTGLRYLLLNAACTFAPVVRECRAVILAGGTMEPSEPLRASLHDECALPVNHLDRFACSHIVDPSHIRPLIVMRGAVSEAPLNLAFNNRSHTKSLDDVCALLTVCCIHTPGGTVAFFGSYDYLDKVYARLQAGGCLLQLTQLARTVFREPRTGGGEQNVDRVLKDYTTCIERSGAALLLAVVGGKLSEGINFADDVGRCVVMVGLPYANRTGAELAQKLAYISERRGRQAADEYYEASCLAAVNQCIGRAIRHRLDYAAIVLADERFALPRIRSKIAGWIERHAVKQGAEQSTTGFCHNQLEQFFNFHKVK